MCNHIKESPMLAATLRICAVYLFRANRREASSVRLWAQNLKVTESQLDRKIFECIKLTTQKGRSEVDDQLLIDIFNELKKFDVPAIKRILNSSRLPYDPS